MEGADTLEATIRWQADGCRSLGAPFYGRLVQPQPPPDRLLATTGFHGGPIEWKRGVHHPAERAV